MARQSTDKGEGLNNDDEDPPHTTTTNEMPLKSRDDEPISTHETEKTALPGDTNSDEMDSDFFDESDEPPKQCKPHRTTDSMQGNQILDILQFFHNNDMLGEALQSNISPQMKKMEIRAARTSFSVPQHLRQGGPQSPRRKSPAMPSIEEHNARWRQKAEDVESPIGQSPFGVSVGMRAMNNRPIPGGMTPITEEEGSRDGSAEEEESESMGHERKVRGSLLNLLGKEPSEGFLSEDFVDDDSDTLEGDDEYLDDSFLKAATNAQRGPRETTFLINEGIKHDVPLSRSMTQNLLEDPSMWILSMEVADNIKTTGDIARVLKNIEGTINLIEGYIPNLSQLIDNEKEAAQYMTNVIQELLKRAHAEGMLKGVQQNWSQWKGTDMQACEGLSFDVQKMVKAMAWTRNNIRAANVTDANDAKMASMSAKEVKMSLKRALSDGLSERQISFTDPPKDSEPLGYEPTIGSYRMSDGSLISDEEIFE